MKIKNKVVIALLAAGIIVIVAGIIFHVIPLPGRCNPGGCFTNANAPGCGGPIQEITPDSSLPIPTTPPYLGEFTFAQGSGPPFCGGVWYAYRYVTATGGYSPLSPWSGTNPADPTSPPLPIYSGFASLPCPVGGCSAWGITSSNTCTANNPLIVITDALPTLPSGAVLNVHRQFLTFDPTSEGELLGAMIEGVRAGSPVPVIAWFSDVNPATNPDPQSQQTNCC